MSLNVDVLRNPQTERCADCGRPARGRFLHFYEGAPLCGDCLEHTIDPIPVLTEDEEDECTLAR